MLLGVCYLGFDGFGFMWCVFAGLVWVWQVACLGFVPSKVGII